MYGSPVSGAALAVALLSLLPGTHAGFYTKKSPVLQLDGKDYERLIAKSNYTSVLEFYAPWCGHCQNLKPAYEKAAKNLEGLVKVAAVDCDEDSNKPFCGSMGIKGFPTLKIVRPSMKGGRPVVEEYQGGRTASDIVNAAVAKINNHVQKVTDKDVEDFLSKNNESAKAILFSEKGTTSALLKSVAIDFLGAVKVAQVRNKEAEAVKLFGIKKYPTLVLLPGGDKESVVFEGEMKKESIVEFLSLVAAPNQDPTPPKEKEAKPSSKSSSAKTKSTKTTAASAETDEAGPESDGDTEQKSIVVDVPQPTATPTPIPAINTHEELIKECLTEKSHTCVLAFVPSTHGETAKEALTTLSGLAFKHAQSKRNLFPFFEIAKANEGAQILLKALELTGEVEIVAINARRRWWRHFEGGDFGTESVERWIDAIRLGEGVKKKLPEGLVAIPVAGTEDAASEATPEATPAAASESSNLRATEEPAEEITPEAETSETAEAVVETTETMAADPEPEPETAKPVETPITHGEL